MNILVSFRYKNRGKINKYRGSSNKDEHGYMIIVLGQFWDDFGFHIKEEPHYD